MSVPIIAGAGTLQLGEVVSEGMGAYDTLLFGVGFVSSAVVGYLAIRFFLRFVVNHSLRAFAYYRFGLAAVVATLLLLL
jgi:undecaprenyl-diphosphatase